MNRFIPLIAGLIVFVAVAHYALADTGAEEGKFVSKSKKAVGVHHEDEWGRDILDEGKGLSNLNEERTNRCTEVKSRDECATCCSGEDKAHQYNFWKYLLYNKKRRCTCFERDNSYKNGI